MKPKLTPLPIQIPPRYAKILGVDNSMVYRVNTGERHFSVSLAHKLIALAPDDPDLAGLTYLHLRPDCATCPYVKQ